MDRPDHSVWMWSLRSLRGRIVPVDAQSDAAARRQAVPDPDIVILRAQLRQALRDGDSQLPARDQWLLRLRVADPPQSYQEIRELSEMPIGSIGPALQRRLKRLRQSSAVRAYLADSSGGQKPRRRWSA